MSIGKRWMAGGLAAMAVASSLGCQSTAPVSVEDGLDEPAVAWWYDMEFEPASATVRGIEVGRFDPAWVRAAALDARLLEGRLSKQQLAEYEASNLSFSAQADLDHDGVAEEFFVGVFETRAGAKGRFVAVTRNGRLLKHFEDTGPAGFSALFADPDEVRWYKCMECGEFESLRWAGGAYVLE